MLLWAALAGVAGCLVSFWAGEIEPSPTIDRADDVASRLGLPVVATLPTGGGTPAPIAPPEPPAWVAVAVRCAEFTLVGILLLLVVGIVRSSELAGQLASDPLTTLVDCCAWWRR
jgi:hypothetical protein